jgi:hypothetical protein
MLALLIEPTASSTNSAVIQPYNIELIPIANIANVPIPSIDMNANSW